MQVFLDYMVGPLEITPKGQYIYPDIFQGQQSDQVGKKRVRAVESFT